jgi:hypothetical protein
MDMKELLVLVQASEPRTTEGLIGQVLANQGRTLSDVGSNHAAAISVAVGKLLNSALTPPPAPTPVKVPQASGGGLAKASAPVVVSFPPARSASEVRARKDAATVNVLANPQDVVSEIMEESARRATERLAAKKEDKIQDLTERIVERAEAEINVTMDFFDQFMERGTQSTLKPFQVEMDDMGATIEVSAMP